ncbi:methyltransferase domain-containing protein [Paenibacillus sp. TRM 82003]|uniref:methyltransferase domain-containing protein n=1 Tax=Kineococcus sp. TRM81007 TaxID=2925831 RepID=UPI001F59BA6C|nr:methyltransferase domain-containing protein [Kineococcus sp. TRM81007]MCI2238923.1 methyltransferase domain-containing protein [Kineococcus sp. TRM81007]MCI3924330.1 methyltransferase domain-containing protein [Paenibacillus sp. TRM 82003]
MGRFENVATLARPFAGAVALDLACGSGRTTRALLAADPRTVHAVDVGSTLDDDLLLDGRVRAHIADLDDLPLDDGTADVAVSLNAVEHLADAGAHLSEVHRVLRRGGTAVLAHSDWDTALFTSDDDALTRTLLDRFVAHAPAGGSPTDGFAGRKLLRHAARSAFTVESVHSWADPHRRFDEGSVAWKVATGVLAAVADEPQLAARAAGWIEGLRRSAAAGEFLFTVTDVAVVLRKD